MKKLLLLITLIVSAFSIEPASAAGQPKLLFCSTYYAFKYKKEIQRLPNDKTMHCAMSCAIALKCPDIGTAALGWLKEFIDVLGPGDADMNDIRANRRGIKISKSVSYKWQCKRACIKVYAPKPKKRKRK